MTGVVGMLRRDLFYSMGQGMRSDSVGPVGGQFAALIAD